MPGRALCALCELRGSSKLRRLCKVNRLRKLFELNSLRKPCGLRWLLVSSLLLLLLCACCCCAGNAECGIGAGAESGGATIIVYFYSDCAACREEARLSDALREIMYGKLPFGEHDIRMVNIYEQGSVGFYADCDKAGIEPERRMLPALFTDGAALIGMDAIASHFSDKDI
ncbi:MAG: hypothetical protein FWH01_17490 [Oscillospiraceae bacterium]|nr:hypothetical protein [Oscillospiraceae bacterium]